MVSRATCPAGARLGRNLPKVSDAGYRLRQAGLGGQNDVVDESLASARNGLRCQCDNKIEFRHDIDQLTLDSRCKEGIKMGLGRVDPPLIAVGGLDRRSAVIVSGR